MLKSILLFIILIPVIILLSPELVLLGILVGIDRARDEKRFVDEAVAAIEERMAEPSWLIIRDFGSAGDDYEFVAHPEHGVLLRTGENEWQGIGADMPEFLPPKEGTRA